MKIMLDEGAYMPTRAHDTDAGYDLYAKNDFTVPKTLVSGSGYDGSFYGSGYIGNAVHYTGVHVEIPEGYVGMVKSKSGLNVNHGLTAEGVIDCGYTGSIVVKLYNHTSKDYSFKKGDKIAQLVIMPIITPDLELVDSLEETERGDGGFGSTGR